MTATVVPGILLLYHLPLEVTAPTTREHIEAFARHSAFPVWPVNTCGGMPPGLRGLDFEVVVLHYSLFGPPPLLGQWPSGLDRRFKDYLSAARGYKIAFFQDEHHYCQARFAFLRDFAINCVYTLLHPRYWDGIYRAHTTVTDFEYTLTGYISDDLVERAKTLTKPDGDRTVDIGYRARRLPFYMGRGGQEKSDIGEQFLRRCADPSLVLDIDVEEGGRIYGEAWWRFLANCRAVLGVEAGVSIFDIDDEARTACENLLRSDPHLSFDQVYERLLYRYDDKIHYRVVSPRHFEAAGLGVCQILFEGEYQGIFKPDLHYLPLKKDLSNIDAVLSAFKDAETRITLTNNAYHDIIESGQWSYASFVRSFDARLQGQGLEPRRGRTAEEAVSRRLARGAGVIKVRRRLAAVQHASFPGRRTLAKVARRFLRR